MIVMNFGAVMRMEIIEYFFTNLFQYIIALVTVFIQSLLYIRIIYYWNIPSHMLKIQSV